MFKTKIIIKDDNMVDEKEILKKDGNNIEGDSTPPNHPTFRLPEFCSRLKDYRSHNY